MPTRARRHAEIVRLIEQGFAGDQRALVAALAKAGIETTQATLSRDFRDLGILKGPSGYLLPGQTPTATPEAIGAILRREAIAIDHGSATIVIRTRPGHAGALAVVIDRSPPPEILGCIAGDDTIFLAARNETAAHELVQRWRTLLHSSPSDA